MVMKSMAKIKHVAIKMWSPIEFLDELAADTSELSVGNKKGYVDSMQRAHFEG